MTSWNGRETNGVLRLNEQLGWGYDAAQNLHLRTNGFLIHDPVGEAGGANLYQPFFNSPLNFSDPDGLDNIYNPKAGQNAVPDLVASLDLATGGVEADYQEKLDPLFLLGQMTDRKSVV